MVGAGDHSYTFIDGLWQRRRKAGSFIDFVVTSNSMPEFLGSRNSACDLPGIVGFGG